jgi:hypothetical protein
MQASVAPGLYSIGVAASRFRGTYRNERISKLERNPFTSVHSDNRIMRKELVAVAVSFDILFRLQEELLSKDFIFEGAK